MRRVTKENLITQIERLYKIKDEQGQLSMDGEYTLQAYKILLATMEAEPVAYSLIFRNMDGVLNNYINTNTTFATREKAETYGKGGNYEKRSDGGLEWVPNTALDPVVIPLYRHAQPAPVVPDLQQLKEIYSIFCTPTTGSDNALFAIHNTFRAFMLDQK